MSVYPEKMPLKLATINQFVEKDQHENLTIFQVSHSFMYADIKLLLFACCCSNMTQMTSNENTYNT